MWSYLGLLTLVALAQSHDVIVGNSTEGRKIFDEVRHASPTIWRQTESLTINTTDAEVISRVAITDLRPNKDGDAKILEGGEGQKNVTIELKSPTVLRGYDFQIEVYSVPENQVRKQRNPEDPSEDLPLTPFEDSKKVESTTGQNSGSTEASTTENVDDKLKTSDPIVSSETAEGSEPTSITPSNNQEVTESTKNDDSSRFTRGAVNENSTSEQNTPAKDLPSSTTPRQDKISYTTGPHWEVPRLNINLPTPASNDQEEKRNARDVNESDDDKKVSTTAKSLTPNSANVDLSKTLPAVNVPLPYANQGTSTAVPTTEKSQNKRETEDKSTTTEQQDVKNVPRVLGEQNSTILEQKPVISIQ
ncbi:uncharacterized protein LOC135083427 [Ostrinia nubilalis]|uniref:uncharacterized protein LOC135083427 n=1 Tax=Ostrinia nubilalis TaxID=29057 RepID=UPI00308223E5